MGGGGKPNVIDPKELGLKGIKVEAVKDGKVVASTTAAPTVRSACRRRPTARS